MLDLERHQRTKDHGLFVGCIYIEIFSVLPAKCLLFHVPVPVFWNEIKSLRLLRVPSLLWVAYYSAVLFGNDDRSTQLVQRVVALDFVLLKLGLLL